tara:strand:- start:56 stop:571 length:516 start_codon:yes stop_codon:yes gene_type:complete
MDSMNHTSLLIADAYNNSDRRVLDRLVKHLRDIGGMEDDSGEYLDCDDWYYSDEFDQDNLVRITYEIDHAERYNSMRERFFHLVIMMDFIFEQICITQDHIRAMPSDAFQVLINWSNGQYPPSQLSYSENLILNLQDELDYLYEKEERLGLEYDNLIFEFSAYGYPEPTLY